MQKRIDKVLGLGSVVFHDSNVALASSSGSILFACSEERLSRKKRDGSLPKRALEAVKSQLDTNTIIVGSYYDTEHYMQIRSDIREVDLLINKRHTRLLKELGVSEFVGHHYSHAAGAYYTSGFEDAYVITYDGGISCEPWLATVWKGTGGQLHPLQHLTFVDHADVALQYSAITALLGFMPTRDEGKVTGLAAYGTVTERSIDIVTKALAVFTHENDYRLLDRPDSSFPAPLIELKQLFSAEDIAATVQYLTELRITSWVRATITNISEANCVLSGGLFANVRLNQKIKDLGFQNIYVYPAMGDEGLGLGAALGYMASQQQPVQKQLDHVYLGPSYSQEEIEQELRQAGLSYHYYFHIEEEIAHLLAMGRCVARFDGAMEFGPRALGNRSILYQTTDIHVNDWLNKRLNRTEFMPFAPATLIEFADECYQEVAGLIRCLSFMTVTVNCTEQMKRQSPAVVHVDGTARPQLVSEQINPSFYRILKAYHECTGIPSLINTSFNIHGEPIVCTPRDAIHSFINGQLDFLALGNFLVQHT